jgi:glucokinase
MRTVEGDMDKINAKVVFDAAKEGDSVAMQVFNRFVKYLTIAINNVISFIDPDMIILGGGVSRAGDFLLDAVKAALPEYLFYPTLKQPELRIASLGNDAGIIGAALLGKE